MIVLNIDKLLRARGFVARAWEQTRFHPQTEIVDIKSARPGASDEAFVVVTAERNHDKNSNLRAPDVTST